MVARPALLLVAVLVPAACARASERSEPPASAIPPPPAPVASEPPPDASVAVEPAAPCEDLVPLGPSPPPPLSLPRTDRLRGVDVSTPAPWKAIREAGFAFAFAAATHGLTRNASFPANWAMAKRCGLPRGAYHFLTEKADGAAQARALLAQIEGDPGELPPVVDLEDPTCKGDCCALSCGDWTRLATSFVETITARLSRAPIVYVVEPFFNQCLCGTFKFRAHPLWLAGWPRFDFPERVRTGGFGRWTFYQHAGNARIGGGVVDLDVFRGDAGALQRFIATGALPE